MNRKTNLPASK